jgi:hypothetical protein
VELKVAGGYETEASKCVESMNKSVIDKLTVLFRNAHAFDTDSDDFFFSSLPDYRILHFQLSDLKYNIHRSI